ncbi:hypothetical protein LTR08_006435 [Meristemomyces frigidus]|nr:hypothetical protein LTR08_006435 [Meristemomyces frigidus]
MHAIAYILAALFAATAFARPAATTPPFEVSHIKVHEANGLNFNTTIEFTIHDPDPLTNATSECSYLWATGSNDYPQAQYAPCGNSSFAWNMANYTNINSFVLGLEHVFIDPAVGDYPYNEVTNFGKAIVTAEAFSCNLYGGQADCKQFRNSTIKAPIYATVAKRR